MSESTAGAKCSEQEWQMAREAGLLIVSTADEVALHNFAQAVRNEARATGGDQPRTDDRAAREMIARFRKAVFEAVTGDDSPENFGEIIDAQTALFAALATPSPAAACTWLCDAMHAPTHLDCTCAVCGQTFTRAPKNKMAMYCRAPACLSEMRRRNGMAGHALRWQRHEPVKPPETAYHTILQPQMAAYIASLAASPHTQGLHP